MEKVKGGNDKLVIDSKLTITLVVDGKTGAIDFKVDKAGIPSLAIRSYLLTVADKLWLNEIEAHGDNRYMRRIGGIKRKGIVQ